VNRDEFGALPVGSVLATASACPSCGVRGSVELTIVLQAKPVGTFSLAGQQMKVQCRQGRPVRLRGMRGYRAGAAEG
jgi:hypothetical protein